MIEATCTLLHLSNMCFSISVFIYYIYNDKTVEKTPITKLWKGDKYDYARGDNWFISNKMKEGTFPTLYLHKHIL